MSPLHAASLGGHVSCVEALIGLKADVLQCDKNGKSPAQIALSKGHSDCVAALVSAGAAPP
jgi:ankyrin repeat protein